MAGRQSGMALAVLALSGMMYALTSLLPAEAVPAAAGQITQTVTMQAIGGTAVQVGMHAAAADARMDAGRLMGRGSAGYVRFDGGYRVLGTMADTREAAEALCRSLQAEGMTVVCYDCAGQALTMKVTGESSDIDALTAAIHAVDMAAVQPGKIAQQMEAAQMDAQRARSLAAMLVSDLETAQADLRDAGGQRTICGALDDLMTDAIAALEPLTRHDGRPDVMLPAEMRCAGMAVRFSREDMIRALQEKQTPQV